MRRVSTFVVGVLLLLAGVAGAQLPGLPDAKPAAGESAETASTETPPEAALEVADVFGRAAETERELRKLDAAAAPDPAIVAIVELLPDSHKRLGERAEGAQERIEAAPQVRALRDLATSWRTEREQFTLWNDALTKRVRGLEASLTRLDEIEALWRKTGVEFDEGEAPEALTARIDATLESLKGPRKSITARRDVLLAVQAEIADDLDKIENILGLVGDAEQKLRSGILGMDAPPIWVAVAEAPVGELVMEREREALVGNFEAVRAYVAGHLDRVALHLLIVLGAIAVLRYLHGVASRWPEDHASVRASATVLARPFAGALLVGFSLTRIIYPTSPSLYRDLMGLIGIIPLVRLLPPLLPKSEHKFVYALVVLYVIDNLRELIAPLVTVERIVFMLEMGAISLVLGLLLRPARVIHHPLRRGLRPILGLAIRIAMLMFAVAMVANALGSTAFSLALGSGVFLGVYAALVLYGVYRVIDGIVVVTLRSELASRLNMVRTHRGLVSRRLLQVVRIGLTMAWAYLTADALGIRGWLAENALAVIEAKVTIGDLTFSPGGGVTFLLVFLVALYLSRLLRFTLEQDVLPRMRLPRGVPYAITATLHYGILLTALMAALAAAGIDLSNFGLLAGALGVGVGFGLQNIVNNFISGLVLLFERPIQTNDVVEVGQLLGKVRRIGIRSSTVRTLDGAEVIVPNANLISDQVVNWTLSDRQRRIDISIGVKYGTDPEQVLALLKQLAADDERVLDRPEPDALFVGFGDSSLDFLLRVWTPGFDEWIQIRSDLNVAVNRALAEAGIEIPFPQRDLHLRSISDDAAARFRSDEGES